MSIAVIPARGGSKRIPKKNIKLFAGKPIIAYSIEAAQATGLFDRIIVSTDDEEIAQVATLFGAEIPFIRPKDISDDYTGTNAVVKHAINWINNAGTQVEYACCIYATAPLLRPDYLLAGFKSLSQSDKLFAFAVTHFSFAIQRALRINEDQKIEAIWPKNITARSQDLEETYHDAGQFYWGRAEAFTTDMVMYSPVSLPVILPSYLVQDIDTPEDWFRAELMYTALKNAGEMG